MKKALKNVMLQALPEKNKTFFLMGLLAWPLKICKLKGQAMALSVLFKLLSWAFRMLNFVFFAGFPDRTLNFGTFCSALKLHS